MTKEEIKLAHEALEYHNFAIAAIKKALAQPEQTNIERHEANVQKFLGAPQPEQEPVAWRFTGIAGLKRYMTQKQYDAQTPDIKKWYEPFKCKNCTTPPQPQQEPVACPKNIGALGMPVNVPVTPPQRTWVELTENEIEELFQSAAGADEGTVFRFAAALQAKLKERNT